GELVLARNRLSQLLDDLQQESGKGLLTTNLVDVSSQIDFITSELQNAVMKIRMVPIGMIFNRFPRLVRDISREFSKKIELEILGADTELDKSVIEEIGDPLVHLVRNSADHGIEPPEERLKKGKPEQGIIRLSAEHEGEHIIIRVQDDGRGIDPEKILETAIRKKILTEEEAAQLTTPEILNLIFAPGFSTSEKVTNLSGRGVGMDVVKTNISRLNGTVSIESEPGKGTTFILKIPLTLAIIQGLVVEIGNDTFAIPLSSVVEIIRTHQRDIHHIQGVELIRVREKTIPLLRLSTIFKGNHVNHEKPAYYSVIIGIANQQFALVVDRLIGQNEIVIKPLGTFLKNIPGIAGTTILGDGKVIMILDVGEIYQMFQEKMGEFQHVDSSVNS
ncbi:MAG: chemotaxis protein CheA, partial [Calditrichaeota bacterium]